MPIRSPPDACALGCVTGLEFAEDDESPRGLVLMQNHQLDAFVRPMLPGFVFAQRNIRKHDFVEADRARIANAAEQFTATPDPAELARLGS